MLKKLAEGMGMALKIEFVPKQALRKQSTLLLCVGEEKIINSPI